MRCLTLALCLMPLLAGSVANAESVIPGEPIKTSVEREPINTIEPIYRAYVDVGQDKFTFLIPETFRMGGDAALGKIQLTSTERGTFISLTFLGSTSGETGIAADAYREMLAKRYPSGKFVREFSRPVLSKSGTGFDVEWKGASGLAQTTRTVYVPTVAGVMELTVTTSTKNFPAARSAFNSLLMTLSASVNGKLQVMRLDNTN
jgi:hypothetical protein